MIKFIVKQFLYGRFYLWLKSNLVRVFFLMVIIFLIFYFHSEYLKYVDLKENSEKNYYVIAYINCSAHVKSLSDCICTSGNAVKVVESAPTDRPGP